LKEVPDLQLKIIVEYPDILTISQVNAISQQVIDAVQPVIATGDELINAKNAYIIAKNALQSNNTSNDVPFELLNNAVETEDVLLKAQKK